MPYFHTATPELKPANLDIGSRPANNDSYWHRHWRGKPWSNVELGAEHQFYRLGDLMGDQSLKTVLISALIFEGCDYMWVAKESEGVNNSGELGGS